MGSLSIRINYNKPGPQSLKFSFEIELNIQKRQPICRYMCSLHQPKPVNAQIFRWPPPRVQWLASDSNHHEAPRQGPLQLWGCKIFSSCYNAPEDTACLQMEPRANRWNETLPFPLFDLLIKPPSIPLGSSSRSCHYQFGEVSWTFFCCPHWKVLNETMMKNLWGRGGFPLANSGLPSCYSPTLHSGNLNFKAALWLWCIWVKKLEFIKFTPDFSLCFAATAALSNVLVS